MVDVGKIQMLKKIKIFKKVCKIRLTATYLLLYNNMAVANGASMCPSSQPVTEYCNQVVVNSRGGRSSNRCPNQLIIGTRAILFEPGNETHGRVSRKYTQMN